MEQERLETVEMEQEADREGRFEEAERLRETLVSHVNALVDEGIFTTQEGRAWISGGEACGDHPEWVEELLQYLGEYEYSGETAWREIEELLESPVFSETERTMWRHYADNASYQEKLSLIGLLKVTIKNRLAEREALQKAKYKSVEELVIKIRTAITGDRLEEAGILLGKLNPVENPVGYENLSRALERARIVQTRNQIVAA
jgi:hypothetical protein